MTIDQADGVTPGGSVTLGGDLTVPRMGFGAMRLRDDTAEQRSASLDVLRTAVELGVRHIDTAAFYGADRSNVLIEEALRPYSDDLGIVTKVGFRRTPSGGLAPAVSAAEIAADVQRNLEHLGLDSLDVVNLRVGGPGQPDDAILSRALEALGDLQQQGLVQRIGVSNVTVDQYLLARGVVEVVCVQNRYNLAERQDEDLLERCTADGVGYVPFFPLGGFSPLQSEELAGVAGRLDATPLQVALAWLLQRSPMVLLIPGTSSVAHLRENLAAAALHLPEAELQRLDALGR